MERGKHKNSQKNHHARTNYFIVVVVNFSDTKSISVQIQPSPLAPCRLGSFVGETQPGIQASSRFPLSDLPEEAWNRVR